MLKQNYKSTGRQHRGGLSKQNLNPESIKEKSDIYDQIKMERKKIHNKIIRLAKKIYIK